MCILYENKNLFFEKIMCCIRRKFNIKIKARCGFRSAPFIV